MDTKNFFFQDFNKKKKNKNLKLYLKKIVYSKNEIINH